MRHWLERIREEGLSLRLTFLLMLFISMGITAALLFMTYHTIHTFHALSDATDAYIELQDAADSLLKASDYLTEEAQCYTVLGMREHLDNYFTESLETRQRERAIEIMEARQPDSDALTELNSAMSQSVSLMDREYYAMVLVLSAQGDADIPEPLRDIELTEAHRALSPDEKMALAREMMHDDAYYNQKNAIRAHLNRCIDDLKSGTHGTQDAMESNMHADLVWMTIMIVIQSLTLVLLLWLTTSLGINPLIRAVDHIKHDQKLPIMGAHEFRYLAGTYNQMYAAYKRSIDNLSYKASHDELTGVYNRAGFDLIKHSVDLSSTVFLLFDADRFKNINDTQGHQMGDDALIKIASVLKRNFRSDDYVCRIGGDEFMVLMVHVSPQVQPLIEHKVIQINQDLSNTDDGLPPISVSVGVSMCRDHGDPQAMFHEADIALYYVKEHGRNGCCFYSPDMQDGRVL